MASARRLLAVARWPLGGIRTYMRHVYGRLGGGWKVTIVACSTQENAALEADAREVGADLVIAGGEGERALLAALCGLMARRRFDLIQSHGFISATVAALVDAVFRVPHILTVHGVVEERLIRNFKGRLRLFATSLGVRATDAVYCVSEDMLAHVREKLPFRGDRKTAVIPNGVDTAMFRDAQPDQGFTADLGLALGTFLFGFLGRFMPQKGFATIIQALSIMESAGQARAYRLAALGSGDYLEWYGKLARQGGVEHRIAFLPFRRDVAGVYRALDAVVMPSRWEAYGLVAAEALCCGTPLVASNCVGLREVVADTPALVVPPEDPQALARAMTAAMDAGVRQRFEEYRPRALDRYDVARTVEGVERLFDETARSANHGGRS